LNRCNDTLSPRQPRGDLRHPFFEPGPIANLQLRIYAVAQGILEGGSGRENRGEIACGLLISLRFEKRDGAMVEKARILRQTIERERVASDGFRKTAKLRKRVAAVVQDLRMRGQKRKRTVEIRKRLIRPVERQSKIAAIVPDLGRFRIQRE